jgi:hypothetical protein
VFGTSFAENAVMNIFDMLIIYLACGAPFGVYYAFTSREKRRTPMFFLKLSVNCLFWFQYGMRLILRTGRVRKLFDSAFGRRVVWENNRDSEIRSIQRFLELKLRQTDRQFSVFEFREEFESYVGLTLELAEASSAPVGSNGEFAEITGRGRNGVNERCLHRQNVSKLRSHHDIVRSSILDRAFGLNPHDPDSRDILSDFVRLFELVGDESAASQISAMNSKSVDAAFETEPVVSLLDRAA